MIQDQRKTFEKSKSQLSQHAHHMQWLFNLTGFFSDITDEYINDSMCTFHVCTVAVKGSKHSFKAIECRCKVLSTDGPSINYREVGRRATYNRHKLF